MPWFAVPVQWTLNETVLVQAATAELAAACAPTGNSCDVERCDDQSCEVLTDQIEEIPDALASAAQRPATDLYHVRWEIDVPGDSPQEAASTARRIQQLPDSTATVFEVQSPEGQRTVIDLLEIADA